MILDSVDILKYHKTCEGSHSPLDAGSIVYKEQGLQSKDKAVGHKMHLVHLEQMIPASFLASLCLRGYGHLKQQGLRDCECRVKASLL